MAMTCKVEGEGCSFSDVGKSRTTVLKQAEGGWRLASDILRDGERCHLGPKAPSLSCILSMHN
jgi:hypothetical protein